MTEDRITAEMAASLQRLRKVSDDRQAEREERESGAIPPGAGRPDKEAADRRADALDRRAEAADRRDETQALREGMLDDRQEALDRRAHLLDRQEGGH